jgi:DNA-binding HxlR family transcriptional regulator
MSFILKVALRYRYLGPECVIYKIETAETLLLEKKAATILQTIPDKPISYSQIEESISVANELDTDSLNKLLEHLVHAGLVKKVA